MPAGANLLGKLLGTYCIALLAIAIAYVPTSHAHINPPAPYNLKPLPQGWSSTDDFALSFNLPAHDHPILTARYKLDSPPVNATDGQLIFPLPTPAQVFSINVTTPGTHTIHLWLIDTVGNSSYPDVATASFKYDPNPPLAPVIQQPKEWVNSSDLPYAIKWDPPEPLPLSGLKGYATQIAKEGDDPDPGNLPTDLPSGDPTHWLSGLDDGTYTFAVKSVSNNSLASPTSTKTVKIDKTAPVTEVKGLPEPEWAVNPFSINLEATDETSGPGKLTYSMNEEAPKSKQKSADIPITQDGTHTLSFYSTDVAGNAEAKQEITLKLDQTQPVISLDSTIDPYDRTRINAKVTDSTSGIEDASIYIKSVEGKDDFQELPSKLEDGKVVTHVPDAKLAPGLYQLSVEAQDSAGNLEKTDSYTNGTKAQIRLPLRRRTKLLAGIASKNLTKRRVSTFTLTGSRAGARLRRNVKRRPANPYRIVASLQAAGPNAIGISKLAQRPLRIYQRAATPNSKWRLYKVRKISTQGAVSLPHRTRISRLYLLLFPGDGAQLPARKVVRVDIPARATITYHTKKIKPGRPVTIFGRAWFGPWPIPPEGKQVILQVDDAALPFWKPVVIRRTDAQGRFSFQYTPDYSPGQRSVRLRAYIPKETGWPFEEGASQPVKVRIGP